MPGPILPDYLQLNRANGRAPHKPVLLLAVLKALDEGLITENRIVPSAELINLFNGYWAALVQDDTYNRRFYLPFYHLKNERSGLWILHTLPGFEHGLTRSNSIKSLGALIAFDAFAELREDVFDRWTFQAHRITDRALLVAKFFPGEVVPLTLPDQLLEIERQIEYDTPEAYVSRQLQHLQDEEEEEQVLRGAAFKRKIPELYAYRCAITGLHIQRNKRASMIDACHIVPWADSHDDTITNGIALCPNMHRAFDRGLISVAADHTVLVSNELREADTAYAIRPFAGKRLILPDDTRHHPGQKNLVMHRQRFGFN